MALSCAPCPVIVAPLLVAESNESEQIDCYSIFFLK
jgi:hypothetical protein